MLQVAAKKPRIEEERPSRTRRKLKGSHKLKVSSEITLKELKVMVSVSLASFKRAFKIIEEKNFERIEKKTFR